MKRKVIDYINNVIQECDYLLVRSESLTYEEFLKNEDLKKAFVRSLEIIGEASRKIPVKIKKEFPEIDWRSVVGIRNKLIHEYFGVDYKVVWDTVKIDIPQLKDVMDKIYKIYKKEIENE